MLYNDVYRHTINNPNICQTLHPKTKHIKQLKPQHFTLDTHPLKFILTNIL